MSGHGDTVITQKHEHQDMGIQGIGFFFHYGKIYSHIHHF